MADRAQTTANAYDELVAWTREAIAPRLSFLVPPRRPTELKGYVPKYAQPTVFEHFVPSEERLADGTAQTPSLAVQLLSSTDNPDGTRSASMRYALTIWDPGKVSEPHGAVERNGDGWRSLFTGLDEIAAALESADTVAGRYLDRTRGVEIALVDQDREVLDFWPYWLGRVDFTLVSGTPRPARFAGLL